jgi:uncharacterized membrane protein
VKCTINSTSVVCVCVCVVCVCVCGVCVCGVCVCVVCVCVCGVCVCVCGVHIEMIFLYQKIQAQSRQKLQTFQNNLKQNPANLPNIYKSAHC